LTLGYDELSRRTRERDRSLREKVMSLDEAAALVPDSALVGIGGSTLSRTPLAMVWALIRAGSHDLVCARGISSSEGELLFAAGVSRHLITSWFSLGIVWGVSRIMRAYTESNRAKFEEWSHMAMGLRFRAGAMGVPFLPMRSMLGSGVIAQLPDAKAIDCPFTGEKLVLVPALNPDFALIHVQRCDAYGNAQIDGLPFMDLDLALAANRVILTTERIVSNDQIRRRPDHTKIPFFTVDAVVEVPFGVVVVAAPLGSTVVVPFGVVVVVSPFGATVVVPFGVTVVLGARFADGSVVTVVSVVVVEIDVTDGGRITVSIS
jgi:glutaconate CoA-transferase subunit A